MNSLDSPLRDSVRITLGHSRDARGGLFDGVVQDRCPVPVMRDAVRGEKAERIDQAHGPLGERRGGREQTAEDGQTRAGGGPGCADGREPAEGGPEREGRQEHVDGAPRGAQEELARCREDQCPREARRLIEQHGPETPRQQDRGHGGKERGKARGGGVDAARQLREQGNQPEEDGRLVRVDFASARGRVVAEVGNDGGGVLDHLARDEREPRLVRGHQLAERKRGERNDRDQHDEQGRATARGGNYLRAPRAFQRPRSLTSSAHSTVNTHAPVNSLLRRRIDATGIAKKSLASRIAAEDKAEKPHSGDSCEVRSGCEGRPADLVGTGECGSRGSYEWTRRSATMRQWVESRV